jgi:hypothetical protein
MAAKKAEFVNQTQGYVGAVQIKRNGDEVGVAVPPGGRVWLSVEEQIATANAPQDPNDNPFVARPFTDYDPKTGEVVSSGVREALKLITEEREIASVRPLQGTFAAGDSGHAGD